MGPGLATSSRCSSVATGADRKGASPAPASPSLGPPAVTGLDILLSDNRGLSDPPLTPGPKLAPAALRFAVVYVTVITYRPSSGSTPAAGTPRAAHCDRRDSGAIRHTRARHDPVPHCTGRDRADWAGLLSWPFSVPVLARHRPMPMASSANAAPTASLHRTDAHGKRGRITMKPAIR